MIRKYRNVPQVVDGIRFDSGAEARRWSELLLLQRAREIHGLERQPRYALIVDGHRIGEYRADFRYQTAAGAIVVEDVKSPATKTPVYRLKAKLMRALYGIEVSEISA